MPSLEEKKIVKTIQFILQKPITAVGLIAQHIIVDQGGVLTVFPRHQNYFIERFFLRDITYLM